MTYSGSPTQYLEATVQAASPAQLRLMLIERAIGVAGLLAETWRTKESPGPNEHSTKLLELLNELLSGVVGSGVPGETELCKKVADLYVFLSQHLVAAESNGDAGAIDEIKTVLEVEAETWRAVCSQASPARNQAAASSGAGQSGLNLQG